MRPPSYPLLSPLLARENPADFLFSLSRFPKFVRASLKQRPKAHDLTRFPSVSTSILGVLCAYIVLVIFVISFFLTLRLRFSVRLYPQRLLCFGRQTGRELKNILNSQ